jgi:uncharacterized protein YjdB
MRAAARTMLAIICVAGAVTAMAAPAGSVLAASHPASHPAPHPHRAAAKARSWLPPTPAYWPQVVGAQSTSPQTVTGGARWHTETYQTAGGAQRAQVVNIDLGNPNLRLGAVEAGGRLIDPSDETISSMATRTGAVAGVNSDFFAINGTGQPDGMLVKDGTLEASPVPSWPHDLEILNDGQIKMTTETFSGTVSDTTSGAARPLAAVNRVDQAGLTAVTPYLGAVPVAAAATIAAGTVRNGVLTIASVKAGQRPLPRLSAGQEDLTARRGTADSAWLQRVHPGDKLTVSYSLAPYRIGQVKTAVSGGAYLLRNGTMAVPARGGGENNTPDPSAGIGVSRDGRHAIMAVFDGHESESQAAGLTRPQFAQWMASRGAYNAIEFDSGGSAEMVARLPGQRTVSVLNTPSDGSQRPVANGLFLYSTEAAAAAPVRSVVNGGKPMAVLSGTTERLRAYATDAEGNPAAAPVRVSVEPPGLATVTGSPAGSGAGASLTLAAGSRPGSGWLVVKAGHAVAREPLTLTGGPRALSVAPADPDLDNGAVRQLSVTGTAPGGTPLTMTPRDATWTVSPAGLGAISPGGRFTAAAAGEGLATVTATAGGRSASATVAVGSSATVVDPMTDTGNWARSLTNGCTATLRESTTQVARPGDAGSMDVRYSIPAAGGVSQVTLSPARGHILTIGDAPGGLAPAAVGVWVKGTGGTPAAPLARGALTLAEAYTEVNGRTATFYPTAVTYRGWRLIEARLPPGAQLPLTVKFLDFLVVDPPARLAGDIYVADLEALYAPRRPATPAYTAIPRNPPWLRFAGSPARFAPGGVTIADWGDSGLRAADHGTAGSVVTRDIRAAVKALPPNAAPNMIQVNGDLAGDAALADLRYGYQELRSFGLPFHDAVGGGETGQGARPEGKDWATLFGGTHYAYTDGAAEVIVTDSAHGGLLASDPYQAPAREQYAWLVSQLNLSTSKDIILLTSRPAYDPHPAGGSQFSDRYEAQMYVRLAADYQDSHPRQHVILLSGQARGLAEQVLDPNGTPGRGGLPDFTVADAGVPAYARPGQGGFSNYALFHVLPDGTVQFAFQPVLATIAVNAPRPALAAGARERLTATGTTPAGDDLAALRVPVADPASHWWSSSNPAVAAVDSSTGDVLARSPGTATISVLSGGVTGTVTVTVSRPRA